MGKVQTSKPVSGEGENRYNDYEENMEYVELTSLGTDISVGRSIEQICSRCKMNTDKNK